MLQESLLDVLDTGINASIWQQCTAIADTLHRCRWVWMGHVGRMSESISDYRLPHKSFFGRLETSGRPRGKPNQTWRARVARDHNLADVKVS